MDKWLSPIVWINCMNIASWCSLFYICLVSLPLLAPKNCHRSTLMSAYRSLSPLSHLKSCEMYICIICYFDLHTYRYFMRAKFRFQMKSSREQRVSMKDLLFWQFIIEFPLHNLPNLSFPFLTRLLHTYAPVIMWMSSMCPESSKELRQFAKILSLLHANSIFYHWLLSQPHAKPSFCILPKMPLDSTMQPLTILSRRFGKIKLRLSFNFSMQFSFLWAFEWKIHFWSDEWRETCSSLRVNSNGLITMMTVNWIWQWQWNRTGHLGILWASNTRINCDTKHGNLSGLQTFDSLTRLEFMVNDW